MTIIQFPNPTLSEPKATKARRDRGAPRSFYPRRFHPLREHTPFLLPILVSVMGAVLALCAGFAVVEIQRAINATPPPPASVPAE